MMEDHGMFPTGIPSALLQPEKRAFWAQEKELALVYLQGEGHAGVLWAEHDRHA